MKTQLRRFSLRPVGLLVVFLCAAALSAAAGCEPTEEGDACDQANQYRCAGESGVWHCDYSYQAEENVWTEVDDCTPGTCSVASDGHSYACVSD